MKKILLPLVALLFAAPTFAQNAENQTDQSTSQKEIYVYPNPATNFIMVNNVVDLDIAEIEVFDVVGKKVKISFVSGLRNSVKLDLSKLKSGIYFIRSYDAAGVMKGTNRVKING